MRIGLILFILVLISGSADGQGDDTLKAAEPKKENGILVYLKNEIKRRTSDSTRQQRVEVTSNEAPYLQYQGKVIRKILVHDFEFDDDFIDTTQTFNYWGKRFIKKHLYTNTREWVIRNNLFIKENTRLDANLVADNERYLRTLDYISDARILVYTIRGERDSIDLVVITRDFLSLIAEVNNVSKGKFKGRLGDANIGGSGQKIQMTALVQETRDPHFGYELFYRNSSIAHSFINATAVYSRINPNLKDQQPDEHTWFLRFDRPLVSQYMRVAGAISYGQRWTDNHYRQPDSLFYNYLLNNFDTWAGYNLGVNKFLFINSVLNRHFVSFRYLRNHYRRLPYQVKDQFNFTFNNREALLGQFTFFRQKYYKTNYIYGFGITEDVPYGYNVAVTGGWYKQLEMERPYAGIDLNRYGVTRQGNVMQLFLRAGSFFHDGDMQDAAFLAGASVFSRVYSWRNVKLRHFLRTSYTRQFHRVGIDPLNINNVFGLPQVPGDSSTGNQRISLHNESTLFIKYRLLGFKFAPFASLDLTYLSKEEHDFTDPGLFIGVGGGLRTRNENIQFGTVELRFMYFPRGTLYNNNFKFTLLTNLRFRSNFNYIKAPDIMELNSDRENNIY